ncbi:MAG: cytochrome c3 family protein [Fibrobacterota bacterium]
MLTTKRLAFLYLLLGLAAFPVFNREGTNETLVFSHQKHVIENSQECALCHPDADSSTNLTDPLVQGPVSCLTCHDSAYVRFTPPQAKDAASPARVTRFSHKLHAHGKPGLACLACHKGVDSSARAETSHRPPMKECMLCHQGLPGENTCALCHARGQDLRPRDHRTAWLDRHGPEAHLKRAECALCHDETACTRCHAEKTPLQRGTHPLNFERTHAIAARGNRENCLTCHDEQRECIACHREQMVMPRSHASAGWSNKSNGGAHARAGRADIESCMACHNDPSRQPVCAVCHGAGTTGATKKGDEGGDD